MKNLKIYGVALFVVFLTMGASAQLDRSQLPQAGQARPVEIGKYETFTLKNGLQVFVIENKKLPRVTYRLEIDRKPILEGDKAGYLGMVGQLMQRGTTSRTKDQLDEEIDFIGASISAGSTFVYGSGLSKYNEKVLELMTDILFNPVFPAEELEKIRTQELSGLASSKDNPEAIASKVISRIVYGDAHPSGEVQSEESIKRVTVDDIRNYHQTYFKPNIAYLAVVGDIDVKTAKKLINKYFGSWEKGTVPANSFTTPALPAQNSVALVNRSASVQSVVNVTYPVDLQPVSPDVIPVRLMNTILGGSSSARLFMNLREDKGYTYGAYSSLSPSDLTARFNAGASVRNEVTDSAVVEILNEIKRMTSTLVSNDELELAKNSIAGSFARSLENPQTVASFAINTAKYKFPTDYYSTYIQKVQSVTADQIMATSQKYLKPENAYIAVVGKASDIESKLKSFGPISYYDVDGNPVDPSKAKLPEGLTALDVFKKYENAVGGANALAKINTVSSVSKGSIMGQELTLTMVQAKGLKTNSKMETSGMAVMQSISDGKAIKITSMGQTPPLDEATKEEQIISNAMFSEFVLAESGAAVALVAVENINGNDAYAVEVTLSKGGKYTLYFDVKSGLKVRYSKTQESPQGSFTQIVDYGDFKEVNGIKFPHIMTQNLGPQKVEFKVIDFKVNAEVAADAFTIK